MAGYFPQSPIPLFRQRNDFCRLYLIIEYRPVLMMYGFEYALRPDVITVAEFGMAARKIVSRVITRPS